jgi:hypothetical protein
MVTPGAVVLTIDGSTAWMSEEADDHLGGSSRARVGHTAYGLGPASKNSKENESGCRNHLG